MGRNPFLFKPMLTLVIATLITVSALSIPIEGDTSTFSPITESVHNSGQQSAFYITPYVMLVNDAVETIR